ncbi:MAG: hypothetical protein K2L50_02580 [Bacteroidales bacterium]|nr:hypothetical protein [Bacteroidales bacterium]
MKRLSYFRLLLSLLFPLGFVLSTPLAGKPATDFEKTAKELQAVCRKADSIRLKEEDAAQKIVLLLYSELYPTGKRASRTGPLKEAVLRSWLAQSLGEYLNRFGWNLPEERASAAPALYSDIAAWSKHDFKTQIVLQAVRSYQIPFDEPDKDLLYDSVRGLALFKEENHTYRPDLKEMLAYRALPLIQAFSHNTEEAGENVKALFDTLNRHLADKQTADSAAARLEAALRYGIWHSRYGGWPQVHYATYLENLLHRFPTQPGAGDAAYLLAELAMENDPFKAERYARLSLTYGQSWGAQESGRLLESLLSPRLRLHMEAVQLPARAPALQVEESNCAGFGYRIFRLTQKEAEHYLSDTEQIPDLPEERAVKSGFMPLPAPADLQEHRGTVALPALQPGFYLLQTTADSVRYKGSDSTFTAADTRRNLFFQVSETGYFCYPEPDFRHWHGYVFNRRDAVPLAGVAVDAFVDDYDIEARTVCLRHTFHTLSDSEGGFQLDSSALGPGNSRNRLRLRFTKGNDTLWFAPFRLISLQGADPVRPRRKTANDVWADVQQIFFFPNLPVYRPGDSVSVKALVVAASGDSSFLCGSSAKESLPIEAVDPEGKIRISLLCKVAANGIADIAFKMPPDARPGRWTLRTGNKKWALPLQVEYYKRPAFALLLADSLQTVSADSLCLSGIGSYYSGGAVQGGMLYYRIYTVYAHEQLWASGEVGTDAAGRFTIRFAKAAAEETFSQKPFYRIECQLSDQGGETRHARRMFPLSEAAFIHAEAPSLLISDGKRWRNRTGQIDFDTARLGTARLALQLFRLTDTLEDSPFALSLALAGKRETVTHYLNRKEFVEKLPFEPYFSPAERNAHAVAVPVAFDAAWTQTACRLPADLPAGCYEYRLLAFREAGDTLSCTGRFLLARTGTSLTGGFGEAGFFILPDNATPPVPNSPCLSLLAGNASPKPMLWRICVEDAAGNRSICTRKVMPGCSLLQVPLEGLSPRGNWSLTAFSQTENRYFFASSGLDLPQEDANLKIEAIDFPDSVQAGQTMRLVLRIPALPGMGTMMPVLAGMYDASLHAFASRQTWPEGIRYVNGKADGRASALRPPFPFPPYTWNMGIAAQGQTHTRLAANDLPMQGSLAHSAYPAAGADFRWQGVLYSSWERRLSTHAGTGYSPGGNPVRNTMEKELATEDGSVSTMAMKIASEENSSENGQTDDDLQEMPRRDFRPDVFFTFVNARKEKDAYLLDFSAQAPEYFGAFSVRAFAYSDGLYSGFFQKDLRVYKPVMLYPQLPRSVRENDSVRLRCRYMASLADSTTEARVQVSVCVESPGEENRVLVRSEEVLPEGAMQGVVQTALQVPEGCRLMRVEYRMELYRKGEKKPLAGDAVSDSVPVLPCRTVVRRVMPFGLRTGDEKNVVKATLVSDFPLPADSLRFSFSAHPRGFAQGLWDGVRFDSCKTSTDAAVKMACLYMAGGEWKGLGAALRNFAAPEGGWGWLKGDRSNAFITTQILYTLCYIPLRELQALRDWRAIVIPALRFLLAEMQRDMQRDSTRTGTFEANKIACLYVLAAYREAVDFSGTQAVDFYRQRALEALPRLLPAQKALLLRYLLMENRMEDAARVSADLNALALYHPLKGMYWKEESLGQRPGQKLKSLAELACAYREGARLWAQSAPERSDSLRWRYREILNRMLWMGRTVDFNNVRAGAGLAERLAYAAAMPSVPTRGAEENAAFRFEVWMGGRNHIGQGDSVFFTVKGTEAGKFRNRTKLKWTDTAGKGEGGRIGYGYVASFLTENLSNVHASQTGNGLRLQRTYRNLSQTAAPSTPSAHKPAFRLGNRIQVRLELRADRDMSYVHLRCPKPAGLEWENTRSGHGYAGGLPYYKAVDDTGVDFFIELLPKGLYRFDLILYADTEGSFSDGPAWVECAFDSGFGAHSDAGKIRITP